MGAQQSKSDDELLNGEDSLKENISEYIKKNNTNEREEVDRRRLQQDEHNFICELEDTVIPDQYHNLLPMNEMETFELFDTVPNKSSNSITVAAFATITTEFEEEPIENSKQKVLSDSYKSIEIKRELLTEDTASENQDVQEVLNSYLNSVEQNQEIPHEQIVRVSDLYEDIEIKRELLRVDTTSRNHNAEEERNLNLESIDSVQQNREIQKQSIENVKQNTLSDLYGIEIKHELLTEDTTSKSENQNAKEEINLLVETICSVQERKEIEQRDLIDEINSPLESTVNLEPNKIPSESVDQAIEHENLFGEPLNRNTQTDIFNNSKDSEAIPQTSNIEQRCSFPKNQENLIGEQLNRNFETNLFDNSSLNSDTISQTSYIEENTNFQKNQEIKQELLETHGIELETSTQDIVSDNFFNNQLDIQLRQNYNPTRAHGIELVTSNEEILEDNIFNHPDLQLLSQNYNRSESLTNEQHIQEESNKLNECIRKDSLNIEDLPLEIKKELVELQVDESINTNHQILQLSNLENENIHDDTSNFINKTKDIQKESSIIHASNNSNINYTNKESYQTNDLVQNNLLIDNTVVEPPNILDTPIDIKSELEEIHVSDNLNSSDLESSLFNDLEKNCSSNECILPDLLNIKEPDKGIKTESVEVHIDQNINTNPVNSNIENSILTENANNVSLNVDIPNKKIKTESLEVQDNTKTNVENTNKKSFLKYDLVRNPFAFLKNLYKPKEKLLTINQQSEKIVLTNQTLKPELKVDSDDKDDVIVIGQCPTVIKNENLLAYEELNESVINVDKVLGEKDENPLTITANELIIKSDTLDDFLSLDSNLHSTNWYDVNVKQEQIEDNLENYQLPFIDINDDLNTSLDVNVDGKSSPDLNIDDIFFSQSQSADDVLSNSTLITSPRSSEYHSIVEISSLDDFETLIPTTNLENTTSKLNKGKPGRPKGAKNLKPRSPKQSQGDGNVEQTNKKTKQRKNSDDKISNSQKPKSKPRKSIKYTEKDTAFKSGKLKHCKNLPKRELTRNKQSTQTSNSQKTTTTTTSTQTNPKQISVNDEFPKPLKLEMDSNQGKDIATDLPRPLVFKSESSSINVKETQSYKSPEFQPFVRLKRLKIENELLVPLKIRKLNYRRNVYKRPTRSLSKSYPFVTKSTSYHNFPHHSMDQREFLIQKAYSLNPRVKLNRWSMDNEYPPLDDTSGITTPYSLPTDNTNDSESKYFTTQELNTLFQSPTPERSSMFSCQFDSGVSTSTPRISHHPRQMDNKTLLLEIAAKRAFINNHLMHFGFSPMHFQLYNDVNDLNCFLKYLFGQLNQN